jgi:2'-5' RNA ligase
VNLRAFVALELDQALKDHITESNRRLKEQLNGVRWVSAENLHFTLRFLGASSPESLERLEHALRIAATACPACEAKVSGLGMFPERGSPRVLWLGTELPEPVFRLQEACEAAAVATGFPPESRPFRSHLTLGRFREGAARPTLPSVEPGVARLERLILFKSDLRRAGAVYTPLQEFRLGGP